MCGYCTEGMMMQEFVNSRLTRSQINIDDLFLPQYLQDYEDVDGLIKNQSFFAQYLPDVSGELVDILFCRLYDQFLFHGHDGALFDYLLATIGVEQADQFFTARHHCQEQGSLDQTLGFLAMPDFYQDKQIWDLFTQNNAALANITAECLRRYVDWWLLGKSRAKDQDGFRRLEETGIYDPIMDTPQKEWDKCNSMFPSLYFALAFLSRTQPHSDIVKTIALTCPDGTPDLIGNDLWMQRRAFLSCVKEYGIDFIVDHIQKIRPSLICHAVLNIDFPPGEYERLHLVVLSEVERTGGKLEYDVVVRLGDMVLGS
jgi:hypothetical protein